MNKFFYILIVFTIIFSFLSHVEHFNTKIISFPIKNTSHCKLHPTHQLAKEIDDYYKKYSDKRNMYLENENDLFLKSLPKLPYLDLQKQYKTPKHLLKKQNINNINKYNSNKDWYKPINSKPICLQKQTYPNTPYMNLMIQNGTPIKMLHETENILPKFKYMIEK